FRPPLPFAGIFKGLFDFLRVLSFKQGFPASPLLLCRCSLLSVHSFRCFTHLLISFPCGISSTGQPCGNQIERICYIKKTPPPVRVVASKLNVGKTYLIPRSARIAARMSLVLFAAVCCLPSFTQ